MAWSKKGSPATILDAISAQGLIKCSLRLPHPPPNKKRKREKDVGHVSKGTVTGHYVGFLKATMDEMDQYPHMKGHCLVIDSAPIHTLVDIAKYVESRCCRCVNLPPYSPELNPIEQFWSVVKSKVKRNKLLETETLMTRISEASNNLNLSDFIGFVWNSHKYLDK
jgi:transposase